MTERSRDLIVLAADKSMKVTVEALLSRPEALGIRPMRRDGFDVFVQINYDASLFLTGHELLRSQAHRYRYGVLMCDRHGCGREQHPREQLEAQMEQRLRDSGWRDRSAAIVIDPELEVWLWADSPHVDQALGWQGREPGLRKWLFEQGYLTAGSTKPSKPQECVDNALRIAGKPRSSAIFREVAERVSLRRCEDPAFRKLANTLRHWFRHSSEDAAQE